MLLKTSVSSSIDKARMSFLLIGLIDKDTEKTGILAIFTKN
jgi:hypothetical protein